jgi:predicted nucleotidyltransferase
MGVIKIGLFGSYVRGDQQADSDIDVLLEMNSPSYRDFMNVWNFLEDNLGRKVDIGEEHLLKEIARPYILGEVRYVEGF